jgi:hypothetical protein
MAYSNFDGGKYLFKKFPIVSEGVSKPAHGIGHDFVLNRNMLQRTEGIKLPLHA